MDDKRYTLMNKNRPVLDFLYNLDTHHVTKLERRSYNENLSTPNMPRQRHGDSRRI